MNARQFLDSLLSNSIISSADVAGLRAGLSAEQLTSDAESFARELVKDGKLTKYQAANIYRGRGKGLVFGEYVVLDKLGAGGMGQVFKAQHRRMKRIVALKILPPKATNSEAAVKRFYQEVEMAARLHHPNIVTAFDAGESHGLHYLAMEYVDGRDLSGYLTKYGPLSVDQAMNCVLQAAQGLEYAHGLGIVHRDIKPSNLLVDRKAIVKILDMGLARIDSAADQQVAAGDGLTMAGEVLGTLDYMSPEQARDSRHADARADVYSLGCTLFRLLTDKPPYQGDTIVKKLLAHREQPIPSLRAARSEVPYRLDVLFQQMLAKDPARRPQSMTEIVVALKALLSGKSDEESSISVLDEVPAAEEFGSFLSKAAAQSGPILRGPGSSLNLAGSDESPLSELTPPVRSEGSTRRQRRKEPTPALPKIPRIRLSKPVLIGGGSALLLIVVLVAVLALRGGSKRPVIETAAQVAIVPEKPKPVPTVTYGPAAQQPIEKKPPPPAAAASKPTDKAPPTVVAKSDPPAPKKTEPPKPPEKKAEPVPPKPADKPAPPPRPQPLTAPVDLLKLVDVKRDVAYGRWTLEQSTLVRNPGDDNARVQVPFTPPSDYDLSVTFEQRAGSGDFAIGLYVAGVQTRFIIPPNRDNCWVELRNGGMSYPAHERVIPKIAGGSSVGVVCSVRGKRIYVTINNILAIDWSGDAANLYVHSAHVMPNQHQLFLESSSKNDEIRVSKMEISPATRTVPTYGRVDLLASIELPRDRAGGEPELKRGDLLLPATSESNGSRVFAAIQRPNEYTLTAVVERISGSQGFGIGLPLSSTRIGSMIDLSGSETGLFSSSAGTRREPDHFLLPPWQSHVVVYTLYRDRLALAIDGRTVVDTAGGKVDFGGRYNDLEYSVPSAFTIRSGPEAGFRVRRLELTPRNWQPLTLPEPTALAAARKAIESLIPAANQAEQKLAGAEQLWRQAAGFPEDAARRYGLLEAALGLAGEAGDLPLVCRLAMEMDRTFAGEHRDLYGPAIADSFKSARTAPARQTLITDAQRQIAAALVVEDYDLALALQTAAAAVKPLPVDLAKELKACGTELTFAKSEKEAADKALASLASLPSSSPAAHNAVGRYLALVRGAWEEAAGELAKGDDSALAAAVKAEVIGARLADDQVASGEKWWAVADKATGPLKWACLERAAVWYNRAAATASGKAAKLIDQRAKTLLTQRKQSNFAFAPRHPVDSVKLGDRWYMFYRTPVHWKTAAMICENVGGRLPILRTPADNQALAEFLGANAGKDEKMTCWLGCTDEAQEGTFRWPDGTTVDAFVNWRSGEPNNGGGNEDYGYFNVWQEQGQVKTEWLDVSGTANYPVVCEWDR